MKRGWKYAVLIGAFLGLMHGEACLEDSLAQRGQLAGERPCKHFLKWSYFADNSDAPKLVMYFDGKENREKYRPIAILQSTLDNGVYDVMAIEEGREKGCMRCHRPNGVVIEPQAI
jgi:hypothetical protein